MMSLNKNFQKCVNNLIRVFKSIQPVVDLDALKTLEAHGFKRSASGQKYIFHANSYYALEKATQKIENHAKTYPREKLKDSLADIVVSLREDNRAIA